MHDTAPSGENQWDRIAALEAAVIELLTRLQHLEREASDRRLAGAVRDMSDRKAA